MPIEKGARENMIVWLFGKGGDVRFAEYAEAERMGVEERRIELWSIEVRSPPGQVRMLVRFLYPTKLRYGT